MFKCAFRQSLDWLISNLEEETNEPPISLEEYDQIQKFTRHCIFCGRWKQNCFKQFCKIKYVQMKAQMESNYEKKIEKKTK